MSNIDRYADLLERVFVRRDDRAIDELVAPDYTGDYGGNPVTGRDALRAVLLGYRDALADATIVVDDAHEHGGIVWMRWQNIATHRGTMLGVAPTYARIKITGLAMQRFVDGVMVSGAVQWDRLTLAEQLRRASSPGAIYRAFIERVFEGGDLAAIPDFIDEDYLADEEGGERRVGHEGAKRVAIAFRGALPNLRYEIHDLVEDGNRVFAKWTVTGDHGGTLFGIPATGRRVSIRGMSINEVRNGRIWRGSVFWDRAALAKQLGQPVTAALWTAP